ncbi:MAG TPA: hypothetical protein VGG72_09180 [Bryobacteraceae bacterium]
MSDLNPCENRRDPERRCDIAERGKSPANALRAGAKNQDGTADLFRTGLHFQNITAHRQERIAGILCLVPRDERGQPGDLCMKMP